MMLDPIIYIKPYYIATRSLLEISTLVRGSDALIRKRTCRDAIWATLQYTLAAQYARVRYIKL